MVLMHVIDAVVIVSLAFLFRQLYVTQKLLTDVAVAHNALVNGLARLGILKADEGVCECKDCKCDDVQKLGE